MMCLRHPSIIETLPNEFPDLKHEFGKQSTTYERHKMLNKRKFDKSKVSRKNFQMIKCFREAGVPDV